MGEDPGFTWADLYAIIVTLPYDSPLERQRNGKDWHWYSPHADLLGGIYDKIGIGIATQANRPKWKKSDLPKPLTRPWDIKKHVEKLGKTALPLAQLRKRLGWDKGRKG